VDTAFLSHPLGQLWITYNVHLWLIAKRVVDFLLLLIEPFSLGIMAEVLVGEYRLKIGDFAPVRSF